MSSVFFHHRRGSGLVRAAVVAVATLAILLVCYSIYQYSQLDSVEPKHVAKRRLPELPTATPALLDTLDGEAGPRAKVGPAVVGPGRKFKLTLFRPDDDRAWGEISVESYTPVTGSPDEYLLVEPEFRMRTKDGHAVRTTARQAVLKGKGRGGLDTERGRLLGNVVIEYDRLTEKQRNQLPPPQRDTIEPDQIVRIETDELQFDVEYSKVAIPGDLHIRASDVVFDTQDVEVRFDESQGSVEYLRISGGGKLQLRGVGENDALSIPGVEAPPEQRWTIAEWLRRTIRASLAAQQRSAEMSVASEKTPSETQRTPVATEKTPVATEKTPVETQEAPTAVVAEDGTPMFDLNGEEEESTHPVMRYFARFEDHVEARKTVADTTEARLRASVLEILRVVSAEDRARIQETPPSSSPQATRQPSTPREDIMLTWAGKLLVDACLPEDPRCAGEVPSRIVAKGTPVRLSSATNEAICTQLRFEPQSAKVWMDGTEDHPLILRSVEQGTMTGRHLYSQRVGDTLSVGVDGPGMLIRPANENASTLSWGKDPTDLAGASSVRFSDRLDVAGRFVRRTTFHFAQGVSTREYRVLDRATFLGAVHMEQDETRMDADRVILLFSDGLSDGSQTMDRVQGQGHVVMTQRNDRVTCGEIDLRLTKDRHHKIVPLQATARHQVEAVQGNRTIRARDELVIDFAMVDRPPPPFDAAKAYRKAREAGLDPTRMDWEARRRQHDSSRRREVGIQRLRAAGNVEIVDPAQPLELSAAKLNCTVAHGNEIESAVVYGTEQNPASVDLDRFSVTGQEIRLHVPDEWARVPGAGRMTFLSFKDLDGHVLDKPIPISITWQDWMKYQGRENRSVFSGNVHAESAASSTFECKQFMVEFEDVARADDDKSTSAPNWWVFEDIVKAFSSDKRSSQSGFSRQAFAKEPAYILATGDAIAQTSEFDPVTGELRSRARLAGPKLSVNLRSDVSKMLIEGRGSLLLEDYQGSPSPAGRSPVESGLFGIDQKEGPSKTLIQWTQFMSYDFSMNQTWFEGDVSLKYFSGTELENIFGHSTAEEDDPSTEHPTVGRVSAQRSTTGRSTFLTCRVLTADFLGRGKRSQPRPTKGRVGALSAAKLKQFHASGSVTLQDVTEGLYLACEDLTYEQERRILLLQGTERRLALIVRQRRGERPQRGSFVRCVYDLDKNTIEAYKPTYREQ